jgi:hypothetical protein
MTTASLCAHTRQPVKRWTPAREGFAAWRRKAGAATAQVAARAAGLRRTALTVAGFGFVDAAAYEVGLIAGLVSTGVSLWLLEWLSD